MDQNSITPRSFVSQRNAKLTKLTYNFRIFFGKGYPLFRTSLVAQMVKASPYNVGDLGSIPGSGRSPGEGNGNPLQDSCLENPMDREAW